MILTADSCEIAVKLEPLIHETSSIPGNIQKVTQKFLLQQAG